MQYQILRLFFVITLTGRELKNDQISGLRGLAKRSPFLAGCFFLSLLSLAGIPPLAGFFGKFLILLSAVQGGLGWLALIGALSVAVSLFYYLNVVRMMYIEESSEEGAIKVSGLSRCILLLLCLGILIIGFYQAPFLEFAQSAAHALF